MKKILALVLVLSLCFTLLCACKKETGKTDSADESTSGSTEETTVDVTTMNNYYQDQTPPEVVNGQVTHKVYQAWWNEEGELTIQMYIINGMEAPIYELFIEEFCVYTEEGQIAQLNMGPLGMDPIPAGEYVLETFYLGYGVDLPDADLSTLSVDCLIDFYYD